MAACHFIKIVRLLLNTNFSRKMMKKLIILLIALVSVCWSIPKPMESITNYNVMMIHGAYGPKNDDGELQGFQQLCLM